MWQFSLTKGEEIMKYTIEGFSQLKLVELKMDLIDAVILRWFIDFKDTGKMYSEIIENDKYYWIKYDQVIEDLPIISLVKTSLGKRVRRLAEIGVLKHHTKKQNGTFSMYAVGENYAQLVDFEIKKEEEGLDFDEIKGIKKPKGVPQNEQGVFLEMSTGCSSEGTTNNSTIKITNLLNKTEKTEEPVAVSDKESKIRFIANIEKVKLDEKFIKELANKFSLEKITEWLKAVPQDKKSNNAGAYIRGIIKNQKLDSVTKAITKTPEKIEATEELLNTPKMSEKELRETFLDGREIKDLEPQQLQILNDTLRRMGYGQAR